MQRLTGLPKQRGGLSFDYLDSETGWDTNREAVAGVSGCLRSKGREDAPGLSGAKLDYP